jgi:hypothetical protein
MRLARSALSVLASVLAGAVGLLAGFVVASLWVVGDLTQQAVDWGGVTWFEGESSGSELGENPTRGVLGVFVVLLFVAVFAAAAAWLVLGRPWGPAGLLVGVAGALPGALLSVWDALLGVTVMLVGPPVALALARVLRGDEQRPG